MSRSRRSRPLVVALAVAATASPTLLIAQRASAATYVFSNPAGGALNVSTNYAPSGVPGTADTIRLNALPTIPGFLTLTVAANQTVGRIEFNHFAQTTINSNLDGSSQPFTLTLSTGALAFTDAITDAPDVALNTLFINAPIAGGAGLAKSGPGFAALSATNLYTGGTTISGAGGLSVGKDASLGDASSNIALNTGGTLRVTSSFATNRTITVDSTGGRIESFGTLTLNGAVNGTGPLTIGRFTGGTVNLNNASNVLSGALVIAQSNTVNLLGRLGSVSSVTLGGTLNLGTGTAGPAVDAINDSAVLFGLGGSLNIAASASNSTEYINALSLNAGTTTIDLEPTITAGTQLNFGSFARNNRATAFVRGRDLGGGALTTNRAVLAISDTSNLPVIGGGGTTATNASIVPFLFGNANVTGGNSQISVVEAGMVTRNANGLRPLSAADYKTSLASAAATDNVRLSDAGFTQNAAVTLNSLVIRDTLNSNGQTGITGTGALNITSGAIVAVSDLAGEELYIDNPINFGAEGVVHTAPTSDGFSQLTLRGALGGVGGLTKSGAGDLFLENLASTYSGVTTVNAGTITFSGNVPINGPSALGNSNTDVVINAGVTGGQYVGLRPETAGSTFARNIVVHQDANANSFAFIGTYGGYGTTFTGQVSIDAGFLNLLGDTETQVLTFSGPIVGAGGLEEPGVTAPYLQYLRLSGANTYSGGTVIRAGRWDVASNAALGTGTVYFVGNNASGTQQTGAIQPFGGARTLANALVFRATPVFSGTDALTLTGAVDLGSVPREINVTNTADVTMSGVVSRGGIIKSGSGRLILSGANTYNGQTLINAGALRVANNSALGTATGPTFPGQATFITGTGTLELANSVNTGEAIYFGSGGLPITVASATGNIRNVSGDNFISGQVAVDNLGTIGVDAGSTLTLQSDIIDNTSAANATLRKVGAGTLSIKNVRLPSVVVNAGTLRISPAGAPLGTSRVSSIQIDAGAKLDLTNNTLVFDYATTSPITSVRSLLAAGSIVTSSTTTAAAVGYGEASTLFTADSFPQSYAGQAIDNTTVLLTQTIAGDANLDLSVNFTDLVALAQNYNKATGAVWTSGDFNYDGAVNFNDLVILAQNYNRTTTNGAIVEAAFGASFASDWALAQSVAPEPVSLSVLTLALPLLRRRRLPSVATSV